MPLETQARSQVKSYKLSPKGLMFVKLLRCQKQELILKITTLSSKILLFGFLSILEFCNSPIPYKLVTHKLFKVLNHNTEIVICRKILSQTALSCRNWCHLKKKEPQRMCKKFVKGNSVRIHLLYLSLSDS